jgi:transposase
MSNQDFLSELLGIAKLRVTGTEFIGAERIKLVVENIEEAGVCPECHQISIQVHGQCEEQPIRDLAYGERRCYLSYRARRFRCETCNKTFVERVAWKRPEVSYTLRYENYIYQRARKEPVSLIAEEEGLSEEAVQAIFEHKAKKRLRHGGTRQSK